MRLHNTLTRKTEGFQPLQPGSARLYTCGPTVYDYSHIGNWRSFVFDDTLRRVLEANGFVVKHVMNVTDVGHLTSDADEGHDKLEAGAKREGKAVWDVAKNYTDVFIKDAKLLNLLPPNGYSGPIGAYARATDFISEQVDIVELLLDKGFAYKTEQAIYFDVTKLDSYGELSGQKLSEKEVGAREEVVTDSNKRHPQDFALWFFLVGRFAEHSMRWPSPWGEGFPGWHLECSAIVHATLGDPLDIHTGGVDHIGTHHPNEMAQTEAAYGHKLANYWMHNEFVLVDGQKMSKSLGNFITLEDIIKRGFDPMALRLLFLQSHYRHQMNFTWEALEAVSQALKAIYGWADMQFQNLKSDGMRERYRQALDEINQVMADDLNSPKAVAILNGIVNQTSEVGADSDSIREVIPALEKLFGLNLDKRQDITTEIKVLISEREKARLAKDWTNADELRSKLELQKISINDTSQGPVWSRI